MISASALATSSVSSPLRSRPNSTPQRSPAAIRRRISATASIGVSTGLRRSRWRAVVAASQLKSLIAASSVGKSTASSMI